jgi:anthranilate synthase component II
VCKTLIIDNFDSFTYNLFQYMGEVCGEEPTVVLNTASLESIDLSKYDCIIVSPGPGTPGCAKDVGISANVIRETQVPLLGVCLGHQCMAHIYGMDIVLAPEPMHGRVSIIRHNDRGIFKGLSRELSVVRYHSLVVKEIKSPFVLTAWGQGGMIHGIQHKERPLHGIQFHPESICTEAGKDLLRNFRDLAMTYTA